MMFRAVTPSGGSERRVGSPRSVNRRLRDGERRRMTIHNVFARLLPAHKIHYRSSYGGAHSTSSPQTLLGALGNGVRM